MRTIISRTLLLCPLVLATVAYGQAPKKVSKAEAVNNIASKVAPEYPQVAKQLRIQGSVELEATVAENGTVEDVAIVSGNLVLTKSAVAALKKWKFRPFTDGGKPVRAIAPISMIFTM